MTASDLSDTIQPNSDQLDAVDLLGGARTFTITKVDVRKGAEQPVTIHLAEFDRPWRPGLSMRRVLVDCWGADGATYVGRRVRLYCDRTVQFGGSAVGGTRVEALSDIKGIQRVPLLESRKKMATFTVQPLPDAPAAKPEKTLDQKITELVGAFDKLGVTVKQLEAKVGVTRDDWNTDELAQLTTIGKAIRASETSAADEFGGAA